MCAVKSIPEPSLRRLPSYLRFLRQQQKKGVETVSCTQIGRRFNQDPTQVRKDLSAAGAVGRPRIGYVTKQVIKDLETFLGWNDCSEAFLAGVGSLGAALMRFQGFRNNGLKIVAGFDVDKRKQGTEIGGVRIVDLEKMPNLSRRMHVLIGILTVPGEAAQEVADMMVLGGIRAIWNFAPVKLNVPEYVVVEDVDLSSSFGVLTAKLAIELGQEEVPAEKE